MQKPFALFIAVCFCLTSCQVFEKSEIWENVTHVRPGDSIRDPDPSASYAEKLHRALLEQGVEHIVVTYQYHYFTHQRDEAVETRTAIVYRDNADQNYPWWLKDDRTSTPIWLPNGELAKQISFYIRRTAQVIEQKVYPARGANGKAALGMFRPATVKQRPVFAEHPQRAVTKITQTRSTQTPPATLLVPFRSGSAKPFAGSQGVQPAAVTKIQHPANFAVSKPTPSEVLPAPVAASRTGLFWSSEPVPKEEHLEKLFHWENGTSYDPASSVDRRKMEQLKHGLMGRETSGERGFKHGTDGMEDFWR